MKKARLLPEAGFSVERLTPYTKMHGLKPMHLVLRSSATRAVRAMGRGGQKAASKMR
jgi:hypothetical protein